MLAAILSCGLVTLVAAQQPTPCNIPDQWEGREVQTDYSKNFTKYAKMSYDATNKRVREVEELEFGSERDFYDVLYLYNEKKEYRLNQKTRQCNVSALSTPWRPAALPPNATYDGAANVGPVNIAGEHVTVIRFSGVLEDNTPFYGTVTSPDCIPVSISYGLKNSTAGIMHTTFYDVMIGVAPPGTFTPPKECQG